MIFEPEDKNKAKQDSENELSEQSEQPDFKDDEHIDINELNTNKLNNDEHTDILKRRKSNIRNLIKNYILTVVVIVGIFITVSGALVYAYSSMKKTAEDTQNISNIQHAEETGLLPESSNNSNNSNSNNSNNSNKDTTTQSSNANTEGKDSIPDFLDFLAPPVKTNVLIIGLDDEGGLADVIIVACYDYAKQEVNFISIPRDTQINITRAEADEIRSNGRFVPSSGVMKITELHSYAGRTNGHYYIQQQIKKLLGIDIDYYVNVDLKAFRYIVDAVGGIEMEIRPEGFYYKDPDQDLIIDVPGGLVLLNGNMAEGVVRYRDDYVNGDMDRIPVQHEFMKQFFSQVFNKESIMSNIPSFFNMVRDYVVTDFSADKLIIYAEAITKLNPNNMNFHVMPGRSKDDYSTGKRISYYIHDPVQSSNLVKEIFDDSSSSIRSERVDLKGLKIQVLNGGHITGKAGELRDILRADGYTVVSLGDYLGAKNEKTRIITQYEMDVTQLEEYFENVVIEVDSNCSYDMVIIIGTAYGNG